MAESLVRAAARRPVVRTVVVPQKKSNGKLLAFMGIERRRRGDHGGLQFCGCAGPEREPEVHF